jgi:hypothetical protein
MPKYTELAMKEITVRIFEATWNGHAGMKLRKDKFLRFLDEQEIEHYKVLASIKAGVKR